MRTRLNISNVLSRSLNKIVLAEPVKVHFLLYFAVLSAHFLLI